MRFKQKEKYEHYKAVAKGKKPTKKNAKKHNKDEQIAYARGQYDARNEARRIFAWKNATPEERKDYAESQRVKRKEWKRKKAEQES